MEQMHMPEDEVGRAARALMRHHGVGVIPAIDAEITKAQDDGQWNRLRHWHRVRMRVLRWQ